MDNLVDLSQIIGVAALILAICIGVYYSSQLKRHNSLSAEQDARRAEREQEDTHTAALRAYKRRCAWSVDLQVRWLRHSGAFSSKPFATPPLRPPHLNPESGLFYFGATCAHIGKAPPAEILTVEYDNVNPNPVEALKRALQDFGLVALLERDDFLDHVYLSAPLDQQPGLPKWVRASALSQTAWSSYRFAVYLPALADIDQPSDTGLSLSVVWVHRMDD